MAKVGPAAIAVAFAIFGNTLAVAQEKPVFERVNCVKVKEGGWKSYDEYLHGSLAKLAKVRVENGTYTSVLFLESVYPSGQSARCDYQFVYSTNGFPGEPIGREQTEADMKTAGISMTREAMLAKRDEASYLVSSEIWQLRDAVGAFPVKNGYLRINVNKVQNGKMSDYLANENVWKPLAESAATSMPGTGWGIHTLVMPGGNGMAYNAASVDTFPTWDAMAKDLPVPDLWKKIHPDMDINQFFEKMYSTMDRRYIDTFKVIEVISSKGGG